MYGYDRTAATDKTLELLLVTREKLRRAVSQAKAAENAAEIAVEQAKTVRESLEDLLAEVNSKMG